MKTLYGQLFRLPQIRILDGNLVEEDRINYSIKAINKYYDYLEQLLKSLAILCTFVFNINKAGFYARKILKTVPFIVFTKTKYEDIKVPVDRNGKRSSLLAGIYASKSTFFPVFTIPRKSIEAEFYDFGYISNKV